MCTKCVYVYEFEHFVFLRNILFTNNVIFLLCASAAKIPTSNYSDIVPALQSILKSHFAIILYVTAMVEQTTSACLSSSILPEYEETSHSYQYKNAAVLRVLK